MSQGSNSDSLTVNIGDNSYMAECSQELEGTAYDDDLPNNHAKDGSELNKATDHDYASSNTDSDVMAWYCLGVA